jgi:Heterokaryon incompatibility protein (HET)
MWGPSGPFVGWNVQLNCRAFRVRRNLLEFLIMARSNPTYLKKHFWIDAICIDQDNVAERNDQVSKMGRIYQDAEEVIAWMG